MSSRKILCWLFFIVPLTGCNLASVQHPVGSTPYPPPIGVASGAQSSGPRSVLQPQASTGSQRSQYAWEKALEGMAIGGAIGGIYGAGGGLLIGFLTGFFTAEIYDDQLNTQIQSEQTKDKLLEAKIEQELERQRQLETQLLNSPASPQQDHAGLPALSPLESTASRVAMNDVSSTLASLSKQASPSNSSSPFKNVEMRDINDDGVPDLWIYYSPLKSSEIVRQEEASRLDGRVDTWSHFKDGRLVRREVDSKGKGLADTVYYYENEKIVREERDDNGNGDVSFRALYQNGRRAKIEEDTSSRGKIDRWIYFDLNRDGEIVLKEERDLNGDGVADLWAYYEDGRLVRRDVNGVGAELLSKQDRLPLPAPDTKNISQAQPVRDE